MCDKVAVMYAGKIVEQGSVREIYNSPKHPYTQALIRSIPRLGNKDPLYVIPGQPPNLADLPTGCAFHPRCPFATEKCINEDPPYVSFLNGQESKCWLSVEEAKNG
jgi:oligopeptide/dipeptide ABC transporter ATP-binding protein